MIIIIIIITILLYLPQRGGLKLPLQLQVNLFLSCDAWQVALFRHGVGTQGSTVSKKQA